MPRSPMDQTEPRLARRRSHICQYIQQAYPHTRLGLALTRKDAVASILPVLSVREEATMKVRKIAWTCDDGLCPTVYLSDSGSIVVQGYAVSRADGFALGEGEQAVELG